MNQKPTTVHLSLKISPTAPTYFAHVVQGSWFDNVVCLELGATDQSALARALHGTGDAILEAQQTCRIVMSFDAAKRLYEELGGMIQGHEQQAHQMPIMVIERKGEPS